MNIFFLDENPEKAAYYQNDKHVVKMVLESTQILSTAHWLNNSKAKYKPTHIHHPSVLWASSSLQNYMWLAQHAYFLSKEYTKRYKKIHKCHEYIMELLNNPPKQIPNIGLTKFAIAIDRKKYEKYINKEDPVESYRNYYRFVKSKISGWNKGTPPPVWL